MKPEWVEAKGATATYVTKPYFVLKGSYPSPESKDLVSKGGTANNATSALLRDVLDA